MVLHFFHRYYKQSKVETKYNHHYKLNAIETSPFHMKNAAAYSKLEVFVFDAT